MSQNAFYNHSLLERYAGSARKDPATILSYFGLMPFVFAAVILAFHVYAIPYLGKVTNIISVYGLIVSTFLSGIHWGQHLERSNPWHLYLPIVSNTSAVALWVCYLVLPFNYFSLVLSASFLIALIIDKTLYDAGLLNDRYFYTRCIVTAIVIVLVLLSAWLVNHHFF